MKFVFIGFMMFAALYVDAQPKPHYTASIEAGLVKGSSDTKPVYFFSNGISYKNTTAGIGVGIDKYAIRSIPLFFDVKKSFGQHKIKPFIGASAGINIPFPTAEQKINNGWFQTGSFKTGFFSKALAGVSMPVSHRLRLFINAGYSYKTTSVQYKANYWPEGMDNTTSDIYHYNRWFAAIGFQL